MLPLFDLVEEPNSGTFTEDSSLKAADISYFGMLFKPEFIWISMRTVLEKSPSLAPKPKALGEFTRDCRCNPVFGAKLGDFSRTDFGRFEKIGRSRSL